MLFFKACETVTSHPNSKYKSQGEKRIKIKWLTQDSDNPTSFHYDYEQRIGESRRLFVKIQLLETEEIQRQVRLISPRPRLVSFEMHNVYDWFNFSVLFDSEQCGSRERKSGQDDSQQT